MTDWDKELRKIDQQLESIPDAALAPVTAKPARAAAAAPTPSARTGVPAEHPTPHTWGAYLRLALATLLGVAILFWPYPRTCGANLAAYLAAAGVVTLGGLWSSVWTWRHHTARAHVLSLLLVTWGLVLGAVEILPHAGYAKPDPARPAGWSCTAPVAAPPNILRQGP